MRGQGYHSDSNGFEPPPPPECSTWLVSRRGRSDTLSRKCCKSGRPGALKRSFSRTQHADTSCEGAQWRGYSGLSFQGCPEYVTRTAHWQGDNMPPGHTFVRHHSGLQSG